MTTALAASPRRILGVVAQRNRDIRGASGSVAPLPTPAGAFRFEKSGWPPCRVGSPVGKVGPLTMVPIGVIRTPFTERVSAPRQTVVAKDVPGELVLDPRGGLEKGGFLPALSDLQTWEYLWVIYWFHENKGWRPKVLPPRATTRKGVFATRSPHRPNP